jgi:hypothetical protein
MENTCCGRMVQQRGTLLAAESMKSFGHHHVLSPWWMDVGGDGKADSEAQRQDRKL